jgi:hypothetical protein
LPSWTSHCAENLVLSFNRATGYWVGEDPHWAEHGLDDPGFLAYVQRLAHEDVQVARALELGKHQQVIRVLEVLSMSLGEWSDLPDEPIFDEADTRASERRASPGDAVTI